MDLVNKYRPTKFASVVGQDTIVSTLRGMLKSGDLNPTTLFCGPHGVGKTTLAWLLALYANCKNLEKNNGEACRKCDSCLETINAIKQGRNSPAVIEKQVSERGIDAIRSIEAEARYNSPHKYRFFIIDEVHNLTRQAFDAALRVFEKPQSQTRFILCTTNPEKLPETIRSRAVTYYLQPVAPKVVAKKLVLPICKRENIPLSKEGMLELARAVDGHPRDALNLLAQVQAAASNGDDVDLSKALPALLRQAESTKPYLAIQKYLNFLFKGQYGASLLQIQKVGSHDYFVSQVIEILQQIMYSWLNKSMCDPEKAWMYRNVTLPVFSDEPDKATSMIHTMGKVISLYLDAQEQIKGYLRNNVAVLETTTIEVIRLTADWR